LDYIKLGLFKVLAKISNLIYKLDLLARIKIYPVQHIAMLKPAYGNIKPLVYKIEIYRGQKEDKWDVQKIVNYKKVNNQLWYKVKWAGYIETT